MSQSNPKLGNVLIVDDDRDVLLSAELVLKGYHQSVICLTNPGELEDLLAKRSFHVVLLDMNFTRGYTAGAEGLYWLSKILTLAPGTQVIMATAFSEIDLAVEAIKKGASEFLVKPWTNDKLTTMVSTCLANSTLPLDDTQGITTGKDSVLGDNLNLESLEKLAIEKAMEHYAGNITRIAKALGLGRTTLYRKMNKYGISS